MVVVRNLRSRTEHRKKPRRQFHHNAKILLDRKGTLLACSLADISETGARITLETERELPERFVLLFTAQGETRRRCRVVWREGTTFGLAFRDVRG